MNDRPSKHWGQHFLHDKNVIARIVEAIAPDPADIFVEIGPGRGALTEALAPRVKKIHAIEIDPRLAALLSARDDLGNVEIHVADALRFDFASLLAGDMKLRLAGNLPYNISTPLLFEVLRQADVFRDSHVMLQREVVTRMTAAPDSKAYGRLTVSLAARCTVERLFTVRPGAFNPPPKVDSAVARMRIADFDGPRPVDYTSLDTVVRQAFSMRRKRIANALAPIMDRDALEAIGIDPALRAENLTVESYIRIADSLAETFN